MTIVSGRIVRAAISRVLGIDVAVTNTGGTYIRDLDLVAFFGSEAPDLDLKPEGRCVKPGRDERTFVRQQCAVPRAVAKPMALPIKVAIVFRNHMGKRSRLVRTLRARLKGGSGRLELIGVV